MVGKIQLAIILFALLNIISCSDTKFVIKMHNEIITEFKSKGTKTYPGIMLEKKGDDYYCTLQSKFEKLNILVPNSSYDSSFCKFYIDYHYIESMRQYVRNNSPNRDEKLDVLLEAEYNRLNKYYDSIWILKMDLNE